MAASKVANLNTEEAINFIFADEDSDFESNRKKKSLKKVLIMTKIHLMKITMTMKYQHLSPMQKYEQEQEVVREHPASCCTIP